MTTSADQTSAAFSPSVDHAYGEIANRDITSLWAIIKQIIDKIACYFDRPDGILARRQWVNLADWAFYLTVKHHKTLFSDLVGKKNWNK